MAGITDLIAAGKGAGIFDFYLPFVLMFAIFFGLLQKIKIFGDPDKGGKSINMIVSLVAALFLMVWSPIGPVLTMFFANLFGQTLIIILGIAALAVVFSIVSGKEGISGILGTRTIWLAFLAVVVLAVGVFFSSGGAALFPGLNIGATLPNFGISSQTLAVILVVVITGVIIYFLTKKETAPATK